MADPQGKDDLSPQEEALLRQISAKERRRMRARRSRSEGIWFGLGAFGIIGWSVAVPTVLGILLGIWLDARYPGDLSWTITFLFAGVALGCFNAWYWISREREMIERGRNHDNGE
jgi:ATP synthase protein I